MQQRSDIIGVKGPSFFCRINSNRILRVERIHGTIEHLEIRSVQEVQQQQHSAKSEVGLAIFFSFISFFIRIFFLAWFALGFDETVLIGNGVTKISFDSQPSSPSAFFERCAKRDECFNDPMQISRPENK